MRWVFLRWSDVKHGASCTYISTITIQTLWGVAICLMDHLTHPQIKRSKYILLQVCPYSPVLYQTLSLAMSLLYGPHAFNSSQSFTHTLSTIFFFLNLYLKKMNILLSQVHCMCQKYHIFVTIGFPFMGIILPTSLYQLQHSQVNQNVQCLLYWDNIISLVSMCMKFNFKKIESSSTYLFNCECTIIWNSI